MEAVSVLYFIQNFDIKRFEDCAGYREVVKPMLASGLVSDHSISFHEFSHTKIEPLLKQRIADYQTRLEGEQIVVYGAGLHTEYLMGLLNGFDVVAIADREPSLHGTKKFGLPIISPSSIPEYSSHVVISSRAFEQAIQEELATLLPSEISVLPLYDKLFDRDDWFKAIADQLNQDVQACNPDLLFYLPSHPEENLPEAYFHELKQTHPDLKIITLWWDYDDQSADSSYMKFERESLRYSDLVIENTNASRISKMIEQTGSYAHHQHGDKVLFHPTIPDPDLFKPKGELSDQPYDIAIFGSSAGKRKQWIEFLKQRYGDRFHHIGGVSQGDATLPMAEYAEAMSQAKIVINTQTYPFRKQCKGKVREALACGVLLLEEDNDETRAFCPEAKGIAYFSNQTELADLIDQFQSESLREKAVSEGLEWFEKNCSPQKWTADLLKALYKRLNAQVRIVSDSQTPTASEGDRRAL